MPGEMGSGARIVIPDPIGDPFVMVPALAGMTVERRNRLTSACPDYLHNVFRIMNIPDSHTARHCGTKRLTVQSTQLFSVSCLCITFDTLSVFVNNCVWPEGDWNRRKVLTYWQSFFYAPLHRIRIIYFFFLCVIGGLTVPLFRENFSGLRLPGTGIYTLKRFPLLFLDSLET
jgi:hypothetical protein